MRHYIRNGMSLVVAAVLTCAGGLPAAMAQDYPNKTITIVVPLPPGGPNDLLARQIVPKIQQKLKQNVIVENISGGATTVGTGRVARSDPDGYTLLLHNTQITINQTLYPKVPFDAGKDLVPIIFINYSPAVFFGRNSLPPNTFSELVAWMKTKNAKIAIPGNGTHGHLAYTVMLNSLGLQADFVPYRGGAPALQDVIGGHVDLGTLAPQGIRQAVESKSVKVYGVTMPGRSELMPNVPSLVDLVGPQMDMPFWCALFARTGTPQAVIDKLNDAVQDAMKDPDILKFWAEMGVIPYAPELRTPAAGKEIFAKEVQRWGEVIRTNKIDVQMQ